MNVPDSGAFFVYVISNWLNNSIKKYFPTPYVSEGTEIQGVTPIVVFL